MTFGPDQVIACPRCGAPERVFTLASSNSLGFAVWTDGFSHNSMAWKPPEIVACHVCNGFFWLEDAPVLGRMPNEDGSPEMWLGENGFEEVPGSRDPALPEWEQAPKIRGLGTEGYRLALGSDVVATPERLFRLRLLTYWNSNHRNRNQRRKKVRQKVPWETQNLKALLEMRLQRFAEGHDAADAIAIAEMHRELGAFQECLEWLERVEDVEGIAPFVEKIRELAKEESVCVEWVRGASFAPDDRKEAERMIRMLRRSREVPDRAEDSA